MKDIKQQIKKIIEESACPEEVWVRVEEEFGDAGINILFKLGFPGPEE